MKARTTKFLITKFMSIAAAMVITSSFTMAQQDIFLWQDDDPVTAGVSQISGNLIVNQIPDPTGDADRETVGELDFGSVVNQYCNISSPGPSIPLTDLMPERPFTFKIDYYIPSSTTMSDNSSNGGDPDSIYLQLRFDDVNFGAVGFITVENAMFDTWQSIELTGDVPAGASSVKPLFIFVEGGPGSIRSPDPGVALYIDNVGLSVNTPPPTTVWEEPDPIQAGNSIATGNLMVTPIDDPTGDADRQIVGEVDFGMSNQFSSVRPETVAAITPEMHGVSFSYSVDYYVPSTTTMSDNSGNGGNPDSFYLQIDFDGVNSGSIGFLTVDNLEFDTWNTLTLTGTVPEGALDTNPGFVIAEGGFGGVRSPDPGVALYIDNMRMTVDIPGQTGPIEITPDSFAVTRGSYISGDIPELVASDNLDLVIRRSNTDIQSRTEFTAKTTSSILNPTSMDFTLESAVFARSKVNQSIDMFDFTLGQWEEVDMATASRFIDSTVTVELTGDLSRFVDQSNGCVEARVRYRSLSPRQQFSSNTDYILWSIE